MRGDSKPHSQDNGRSVGLAETLRAPGHIEEKEGKLKEKGREKEGKMLRGVRKAVRKEKKKK